MYAVFLFEGGVLYTCCFMYPCSSYSYASTSHLCLLMYVVCKYLRTGIGVFTHLRIYFDVFMGVSNL